MALKALNGSEIAGKRIKLEHSRPGGARRRYVYVYISGGTSTVRKEFTRD